MNHASHVSTGHCVWHALFVSGIASGLKKWGAVTGRIFCSFFELASGIANVRSEDRVASTHVCTPTTKLLYCPKICYEEEAW